MMGLEEHLLKMFKEDFEFHPQAVASHLGVQPVAPEVGQMAGGSSSSASDGELEAALAWSPEAQKELGRIPFFVRSKAKRNTERYAQAHGVSMIQRDTLYEAKAFYAQHR
jgi:light-independent protochlorophyllide reductase subunit B